MRTIALSFIVSFSFLFSASSADDFAVKNGKPQATIVVGAKASQFQRWVASELQSYVEKLSGAKLSIVSSDEAPAKGPLIVLGGPNDNPLAASAQDSKLVDFAGLKPDGFVLKRIQLGDQPALIAGGNDETGTMYAAYDLLERWGIVFQLTNDIIPERKRDLPLQKLDVRIEPAMKYRGTNFTHHVAWNTGLKEFKRHIDQLAKMKMNCFWFTWTVGGPWVEYSYEGKVPEIICSKESGYLAWERRISTSGTAKDVLVGRECFPDEYLGPPEFAHVQTQSEAYAAAREFLREIIRYAHERKVKVWLGLCSIPYVPPSLVRPDQKTVGDTFYGQALPCGDPALVAIWEAALNGMIEAYPDADAYAILPCEEFLPTDDPASQQLLADYAETRKLMPAGVEDLFSMGYAKVNPLQLDSDVGNVAVTHKIIQKVKAKHPDANLGVGLFFRPYLLRAFDSLLPKDVWLCDMANFLNWKPIMHFYGGIEGRDLIVWPRMDDDGCEINLQLNIGMYERDEILAGAAQHKLAGIIGQMNKERGLECNVRYIAEGAWDPTIKSQAFYKSYVEKVFGSDASETLLKAYLMLDENDRAIDYRSGWRGLFIGFERFTPIRPLVISPRVDAAMEVAPKTSTQELEAEIDYLTKKVRKWNEMAARYRKALDLLQQVQPGTSALLSGEVDPLRTPSIDRKVVREGSANELGYVIYKTESFANYFDVLAGCNEALLEMDRAILAKIGGDTAGAVDHLKQAQAAIVRADDLSRKVAHQIVPYADAPTEKYILFRYNQNVIGWIVSARHQLDKVLAANISTAP